MAKFAYRNYKKVLTDLKYNLRVGKKLDNDYIEYLKWIDELPIDLVPNYKDKCINNYDKKFIV